MSFNKRSINVKYDGIKKRDLAIIDGKSLLEILLAAKIEINNSCGGQASCGTCKVKLVESNDVIHPINELEAEYFQYRQRDKNIRLACQVFPKSSLSIEVPDQNLPK